MIGRLTLLCVVAYIAVADCYSSGAPDKVCGDMIPRHPGVPKETSAPFTISLDKTQISANGIVKLTIRGNAGNKFKGFFVQGRVGETAVGAFEKKDDVNLVNCGNGRQNAATHTNGDDKENVVLQWRAPKGLSEDVHFNTTIVQNGITYWVGLVSPRLQVSKGAN